MKTNSRKHTQESSEDVTVEIRQVTPGGRILYDATSILETDRAKEHIKALRDVAERQHSQTSKTSR